MRRLAVVLALLLSSAAFAQDEAPRLSRRLADLQLGDTLTTVQRLYKPLRDWPRRELKQGVSRLYIGREDVQEVPAGIEAMRLGLRRNRLVDIQLVYDAGYTRQKPVAALVDDLSLVYGQPHRNESRFWWVDGKTVIRVFYEEVPARKDGQAVELRTSLQVMDAELFR